MYIVSTTLLMFTFVISLLCIKLVQICQILVFIACLTGFTCRFKLIFAEVHKHSCSGSENICAAID